MESKEQKPLDVTIDEIYLTSQFSKQDGKCYWTDFPIDPYGVYESPNPAPSLERLDESKGYVPGNVVICLRLFNLGRQRCPEKKFRYQVNQLREHFIGNQVKIDLTKL